MKTKKKLLERNGKRLSYCHGNPLTCLLHYHGDLTSIDDALIESLESEEIHYFNQEVNHIEYEAMALDFMSRLNKEELLAVAHYADSGYKPINKSLITEVDIKEDYIQAIDSSIAKAQKFDKTVYRGFNRDFIYKIGEAVEFKSYTSTSLNPHKAVEFSNKDDLKILMLSTSNGAPISMVHKEMEIVLPRNSKFVVNEIIETDFRCLYPETDYSVSYPNAKIYHLVEA